MSTREKPIRVHVHMAGGDEDQDDDLRKVEEQLQAVGNEEEEEAGVVGKITLNEALSSFARELKTKLQEPQDHEVEHQPPQFSLMWKLLYYHPKVYVKGAIVLVFVVALTLLITLEAHLMLTATWSLLGGLVVVSIISTEAAKRVRQRQERKRASKDQFVREWRCRSIEIVKSVMNEDSGRYKGVGSYVILALFATFGACSIFVVDDEATSLAFLVLFGVFGLIVVLLIGFQAWSKTLGVESYIVVEALFDIVLASQLSASNSAEIAYNATTIALASVATVCTLVRLYMRWNGKERESESILLAGFLMTDAADVVLLASQLFLNSSCDVDPKIVVVAGLLALNPCVTELSAAFKSDKEKLISRNIQRLLQDPERGAHKLQDMQEELFDEQAKRRRMENKSIVQTIVVGLGVFPIVYGLSLVERATNWYWTFIPILMLLVYIIDSQVLHYAYSRTVLNKYFYAASFRLFSALWALLLALTPVYADAIDCNESTAFTVWSLYSIVALIIVTVVKSVQREELLTPMGKEKYEDFVPKILRPARADLASYYVDKLNGARGDTEARNVAVSKIVQLFADALKSGRDKPLVISSLLDAMAYVVEYEKDAPIDDENLLPSASDFARLFSEYYSPYEDDEPCKSFRSSLERAVTTLALTRDVGVLGEVVCVVRASVASTTEDEETVDRRLRSFAEMLDVRETVLDEVVGRYKHAEVLAEIALQIAKDMSKDETKDTTVARYLNNLAQLLSAQGEYVEAEKLQRQALRIDKKVHGDEHPDVAGDLNNLAELLRTQGKLDEAKPMHEEALAIRRKKLGNEHPDVAQSLNNLAELLRDQGKDDEAKPMHEEVLAIRRKKLGNEHPDVAQSLNNLAQLLQDQGKLGEAEPLMREALELGKKTLGPEHPKVALRLNNLAALLSDQGKYEEAKPMYEEAIAVWKKVHGEEHPSVASGLNNLAQLLQDQGKLGEAEPLMREALELGKKTLGPEHPKVALRLNNLARLLRATGDYDAAEDLYNEALAIRLKVLGDDHPDTGTTYNDLGGLYQDKGDYAKAQDVLTKAVDVYKKAFGNEHPWVATGLNNLASLLKAQGKLAEAEPLYRQALAIDKKVYAGDHPEVATDLNNLAGLLSDQGKLDEAEPLMREALAIFKKTLGDEHPNVATLLNNIALLLKAQGKFTEAEPMFRQAVAIGRKKLGNDHPDLAEWLNNLAVLLWKQGKKQEARSKGNEALRIAEKVLGKDHPTTQQYRKSWG